MTTQAQHRATAGEIAVLFPGQGSQRVGMGGWLFREVPEMGEILGALSAAAGRDIRALCARGPLQVLSDTRYTQPAVFAVGIAAYLYLARLGVAVAAFAGHSVGEITALCAAGALTTGQAAALVCERGRLMASVPGSGQMARITNLDRAGVQRCCEDSAVAGRVVIAVQNGPDDHVVSGDAAAVGMCCDISRDRGARHAGRLMTSHAFHSPLMEPAVAGWQRVAGSLAMAPLSAPVILNVTAEVTADPQRVRWGILQQLTRPVEWWAIMRTLAGLGVRTAVTCEAGSYLGTLARSCGLHPVSFTDPRRVHELSLAGVS
jgi:[acyl-carrier-protein] S-malonyltransferase